MRTDNFYSAWNDYKTYGILMISEGMQVNKSIYILITSEVLLILSYLH